MAIQVKVANEEQVHRHELQLIDVVRGYYGISYQTHKGEVIWNSDMAGGMVNLVPDGSTCRNQYSKRFIILDGCVFLESIRLK